jgi:hypothetical protein
MGRQKDEAESKSQRENFRYLILKFEISKLKFSLSLFIPLCLLSLDARLCRYPSARSSLV